MINDLVSAKPKLAKANNAGGGRVGRIPACTQQVCAAGGAASLALFSAILLLASGGRTELETRFVERARARTLKRLSASETVD